MAAGLNEKLVALVEPLLTSLGYELVELEFSGGRSSGTLRVFIDKEEGVGVDDCERVSRELSAALDVHDPIPTPYRLEVSTPGLDRVLRTTAHFERFVGARIELELATPRDERRRYTGQLSQASAAGIELIVDGVMVPFRNEEIFRARLVPEWPDKSLKGRKR